MIINVLTIVFLGAGLFFFFATTLGLLRFPGFYARMHAAGKGDTLSPLLMLLGLILYNTHQVTAEILLVDLKIVFISIFIFLASPTATHAIIDAGYESGIVQWREEETQSDDLAT